MKLSKKAFKGKDLEGLLTFIFLRIQIQCWQCLAILQAEGMTRPMAKDYAKLS